MIHLNTYVMGLRPLQMFLFFQCVDRFRRQIPTSKSVTALKELKLLVDAFFTCRKILDSHTAVSCKNKQQ